VTTEVVVLVGTTKGAFFFHSDERRQDWRVTGPHMGGWEVYSLLGEPSGSRIFAGTSSWVYGPTIRVSEDMGATWEQVADGPRYSPESGFEFKRIWQIVPGHPSEPDTLFAGVEQAGLFVSRDKGQTWQEVSGLTSHPTRPYWWPGGGGMCLHTILVHPQNPQRMWVAASAIGAFRSDDGGATWHTKNDGLPPVATDEGHPDVSRCVHKMVLDPRDPDTMYLQFHGGVFKSTDAGDNWQAIENGLPSNFGFPMVVTPNGDLFVVPLQADTNRYTPDGKLRVYRSRDGGASWHPSDNGLPEGPEYVGVLRDSMATDGLDPAGVYFGTDMGVVYASNDGGDSWSALPGNYPRITCVKTWVR
jgi:hypothetical protein